LGAAAIMFALAVPARAIQPAQWTATTEADFEPGAREHTVVTNLGDIKLAQSTSPLAADLHEQVGVIFDLAATDDGTLYIAGGPQAKLLKRSGEAIETIVELEGEQIFCLDLTADGKLLVGISGTESRLAILDGDELVDVVRFEKVRYIWDVIVEANRIIVATGTDGRLLEVKLGGDEPQVTEILDAAQANILCLGRDKQGQIYAGTDTDGLVYRVSFDDEGDASVFVLFDAAEPEVGALLVRDDGTVYIGTADAEQARPGRLAQAESEQRGRPADDAPSEPQPREPGEEPNLPPKAEPVGEAEQQPEAPAQAQAPATPAAPTAEQFDRLRQEVRRRLLSARRMQPLQSGSSPRRSSGGPANGAARRTGPAAQQQAKSGNAVYRISPDGFVSEVFRESVMILNIVEYNGKLLVATGNEGQLFRVDVDADETTLLADLASAAIPAVLRGPGDSIMLGTANPANLVRLDTGYAPEGTYAGKVLDATQISQWGSLAITADIPEGTRLAVQTRSGNVADPEKAPWTAWSDPAVIEHDPARRALAPTYLQVASAPARYLQYRLTLTGSQAASPVVDKVEITYVVPNLRPTISSIKTSYADVDKPAAKRGEDEPDAPDTKLKVEWEAADPNDDGLLYQLDYQLAGSDLWLPLARDLDATRYEWQTRVVPDGRYILRVTASDRPDNPADMVRTATRNSDPILIDNAAPTLAAQKPHVEDGDKIKLTLTVTDALSLVRSVHFAVDGDEMWKVALPDDLVFDSTSETVTIMIAGLAPGRHLISLRAIDGRGNAAYEALLVTIRQGQAPQE
jgi:hypothetical protein